MISAGLKNFASKFKGELNLLLVTLFWSATFVLIKDAINDISSMLFIAFRFSIAALILLLWKGKAIFRNFDKNLFPPILLSFLLFVAFASQTVGLKYTLATKSAFITGSSVVMIPFLQTVIERKYPAKGTIIGAALVFIGILFLSGGGEQLPEFLSSLGSNFNVGDGLTVVCALFYSVYVVYLDLLSKKYDFLFLVFVQLFAMALFSYIFAFVFFLEGIERIHFNFSGDLVAALIYTSIFATLIATMLQTKYQKYVTPAKAGIIFSFEPVFAAIIAFFAINEKISNFGIIGSLLIFAGLIISESLKE